MDSSAQKIHRCRLSRIKTVKTISERNLRQPTHALTRNPRAPKIKIIQNEKIFDVQPPGYFHGVHL